MTTWACVTAALEVSRISAVNAHRQTPRSIRERRKRRPPAEPGNAGFQAPRSSVDFALERVDSDWLPRHHHWQQRRLLGRRWLGRLHPSRRPRRSSTHHRDSRQPNHLTGPALDHPWPTWGHDRGRAAEVGRGRPPLSPLSVPSPVATMSSSWDDVRAGDHAARTRTTTSAAARATTAQAVALRAASRGASNMVVVTGWRRPS